MEDQKKTNVIWKLTVDSCHYDYYKELFYYNYDEAIKVAKQLSLPKECVSPVVIL